MIQFNDIKSELVKSEVINDLYNSPLVSAFVGVIKTYVPFFGDLADGIIKNELSNFQNIKRDEFCKIVFSNQELITSDLIKDMEFIMEFMKTIDVVNRLSSNDKVKYLANLFKNSYILNKNRNLDEYEEWLSRLSDLSYREIQLLEFLYECDKKMTHLHISSDDKYLRVQKAWDLFLQNGKSRFNLNSNDLSAIISGMFIVRYKYRKLQT